MEINSSVNVKFPSCLTYQNHRILEISDACRQTCIIAGNVEGSCLKKPLNLWILDFFDLRGLYVECYCGEVVSIELKFGKYLKVVGRIGQSMQMVEDHA